MHFKKLLPLCLLAIVTTVFAAEPGPSLLSNGDCEQGATGWGVWSRQTGDATLTVDTVVRHGGDRSLRIEHRGDKDWSLSHGKSITVSAGDILELSAWVKLDEGSASLSVVTRDAHGKTLSWDHGSRTCREAKEWTRIVARLVIPPECTSIQPRLMGVGHALVWCDDLALVRQGSLDALRTPGLPPTASAETGSIRVTLTTADATLAFTDLRTKRVWTQKVNGNPLIVLAVKSVAGGLDLRLLEPASLQERRAELRLDATQPECVVTLKGDGELPVPCTWPPPISSSAGQSLILPVNEGISYPVDDDSLHPMHYHLYGGHGLCMPWYGACEDAGAGWMAIVQTADDAGVRIPRRDGRLCLAPEWVAQRLQFGDARVIRYVLIDQGGHVAMAKRYRAYAKETGLFKTLAQKRAANPNVDLLVGAVNVWCWEKQAERWCRELQSLGIKRILWSNAQPPDQLKALNDLGVLTSRYDIYQDSMNPEFFPQLRYQHGDWTSDAWKKGDILLMANGDWEKGWAIETKDDKMISCGVLCDRQAVPYARERIPAELAKSPYRSRFIDTTTASSWRECWDPRHPMTRSDSKHFRMELLRYISQDCHLVCGSETGHDAAVPYADYFEGMLSLGPYRVPDAGRHMNRIWDEVPTEVATFQTGHRYRLPLWELVYHDCLVAQWYWGDYNNKLPKLWDRRDLWNALYGTPPMFMFDRKIFDANRDRFVQSYQATCPVARATGYSEMTEHRWLTPDHAVQRSCFANGVTVTVNFGDAPFTLPSGGAIPALGRIVEGLKAE